MDWKTELLAIVVTVCVVGQAGLIWWGNRPRKLDAHQLAEARARLLEDAADRQTVATFSHIAKLDEKNKGLGND